MLKVYSPKYVELLTPEPSASVKLTSLDCISVDVTDRCTGGSPALSRAAPVPVGEVPLPRRLAMACRTWPRK